MDNPPFIVGLHLPDWFVFIPVDKFALKAADTIYGGTLMVEVSICRPRFKLCIQPDDEIFILVFFKFNIIE